MGDGGVGQRQLPGGMIPKLKPDVGIRGGPNGVHVGGGMQQVVLLHAADLGKGVKV